MHCNSRELEHWDLESYWETLGQFHAWADHHHCSSKQIKHAKECAPCWRYQSCLPGSQKSGTVTTNISVDILLKSSYHDGVRTYKNEDLGNGSFSFSYAYFWLGKIFLCLTIQKAPKDESPPATGSVSLPRDKQCFTYFSKDTETKIQKLHLGMDSSRAHRSICVDKEVPECGKQSCLNPYINHLKSTGSSESQAWKAKLTWCKQIKSGSN